MTTTTTKDNRKRGKEDQQFENGNFRSVKRQRRQERMALKDTTSDLSAMVSSNTISCNYSQGEEKALLQFRIENFFASLAQ